VEIDEETLQAIAERTEGQYFRATDSAALREVYKSIDGLERSKIGEERFREYREYYRVMVAWALAFAALAWFLMLTEFRRYP